MRPNTFTISRLAAAADGSLLALADVVAWRIVGGAGQTGGAWLPPPATIPDASWSLPAGTEARDGEAVLAFLGDVAPGRSMEFQLLRYGPQHPWAGLAPLLAGDGVLAVANLESVLSSRGPALSKPYVIRAHPLMGEMLAAGGLDIVSLANNHALDYGNEGLDETLSALGDLALPVVGAGASHDEAHQPAIQTVNGVRVAVLAYAAARTTTTTAQAGVKRTTARTRATGTGVRKTAAKTTTAAKTAAKKVGD